MLGELAVGALAELNVKPGDVVECVTADYPITRAISVGDRFTVNADGIVDAPKKATGSNATWRIISRAADTPDLTAITTPFGLLDEATQQALRDHGGPYEVFLSIWRDNEDPSFAPSYVTRVKAAPKRETVTQYGWLSLNGVIHSAGCAASKIDGATPVRITFDRVYGQIDLSTYRVEARP